jgi:hypothetical protein
MFTQPFDGMDDFVIDRGEGNFAPINFLRPQTAEITKENESSICGRRKPAASAPLAGEASPNEHSTSSPRGSHS